MSKTNPFEQNPPTTAIVQREGSEPLWHDGTGKMQPLTPTMRLFWAYTQTNVLFDPEIPAPSAPFKTLDGIYQIVDGYPVRRMAVDFNERQLYELALVLPPHRDVIAKVFSAAVIEMAVSRIDGPFMAPGPRFDFFKLLQMFQRIVPMLSRVEQIRQMPLGKERIAADAQLVSDISGEIAKMLAA